jgi:hypothetical protein
MLLLIMVPFQAQAIEPVSVKGSPQAQSLQKAYNALLACIQQAPEGTSKGFVKSTDKQGKIVLVCLPQNIGGTREFQRQTEGTAELSPNGDIVIDSKLAKIFFHKVGEPKPVRQSYHRGLAGTLSYERSGTTLGDIDLALTIKVDRDGKVVSSLGPEATSTALQNLSPYLFIPGCEEAAR